MNTIKLVIISFIAMAYSASIIAQNQATTFLFNEKKAYLLNKNQLFKITSKNETILLKEFDFDIYDAIINNNKLWVATPKGLHIFELPNLTLTKTVLDNEKVIGLTQDANGKVWAASFFKRLYKQDEKQPYKFDNVLNVNINYDIKATNDNTIYVGTNLGLYKINANNGKFTRYAEEAHSGHGLPDNIVEKLFVDNNSNVWVMMPDHIIYIKGSNSNGEFPTFSYVGNKRNKVTQIFGLNNDSYIMLTKMGALSLTSNSIKGHEAHDTEIFNAHKTPAKLVTNKTLKAPHKLEDEKILLVTRNKKSLYFLTKKGIWKTKEKSIIKSIKKATKA